MGIEVRNLWFTYQAGTPMPLTALQGINLRIEEGEFVGIIGPTGSGKSTLMQHLNGLLRPKAGTVLVDGVDLGAKETDLGAVRAKVGLVFQYPEHQIFEETVAADVAFGPKNLGLPEDEVQLRVQEALEMVGLSYQEVGARFPFELSGGQLRRVAIAGVLAMRPKYLILDEPTAGLDPRGREEILERIGRLHREQAMTILFVTHNMDEVARLAQRLVVMHQGKIVLEGTPREVFGHKEELEAMGLGVPQVTEVMYRLRAAGEKVETRVLTVEEAKEEIIAWWGDRDVARHHPRTVR